MSVIIYSAKLAPLLLDERHLCTPSLDPFHSYISLTSSPIFFAEVANTIIHQRWRDGSELPRPTWQLVPINFSKMRRNVRVLCGRYKSFRIGISDSNNRRLKANHTRGPSLCLASLFPSALTVHIYPYIAIHILRRYANLLTLSYTTTFYFMPLTLMFHLIIIVHYLSLFR